MNEFIKSKILENELKLFSEFPEYKQSIQQFIKKIEMVKYDAMLYELCLSSFKSNDKIIQEKKYNSKGYYSARQLVEFNKEQLDLFDKPSLEILKEGELFTSLDICFLSNNYNVQVGMYYINENNIIVKSTVEDNDRPYNDRWITKNIILQYCMQKETEINLKTLIFSKKPNSAIFNSLMEGTNINVHVFINNEKGTPYKYNGVFHPCGLVLGNRAFLLFKHGYDKLIPYDNIEGQFINLLKNNNDFDNLEYINVINVKKVNSNIVYKKLPMIKKSKRNILQQLKIDLEVSLRGDDIVYHYEKNKLIQQGYPELANKVKKVSLDDMNLGYDISSFEITSEGIQEIFISVKSSVSNSNIFNITTNELQFNKKNIATHKLYRIYDIYTDKPKVYEIEDLNNSKLLIKPLTYEVEIGV